ncbi:MAG: PHP domain-containing protein [Firmicutes bacterium]|nr:PHP domain-containing protein [Bacillota bacterium]
MTNKIDFHMHSTVSDGTMTPAELARHAAAAGISAAAITDHDTTAGVGEFLAACADLGIEGVAGVEISADHEKRMHILGLFVDYENADFASALSALADSRGERNRRMLELCREHNLDISEEDLLCQKDGAKMSNVGRPHFANAMVKKGYVKDKNEAFDKYLKRGKPCYTKRLAYSPKKCIDMIHAAGGLAVLAHPISISRERDELFAVLSELKSLGLDGAEAYYSEYTKDFSDMCMSLCGEIGLLPSGGSDFHGANKPNIPIGIVNGGEAVPRAFAENMKRRLDYIESLK